MGDLPMRWKEWQLPLSQRRYLIPVIGGVGMALLFQVAVDFLFDHAIALPTMMLMWGALCLEIVILARVGIRGFLSVAREREVGSWDSLLASPLPPEQIIGSKVAGATAPMLDLALVLAPACILSCVQGGMRFTALIRLAMILWPFGRSCAAIGVWGALNPHRSVRSTAIICSVLFAPMVFALPVLFAYLLVAFVPLGGLFLLLLMPVAMVLVIIAGLTTPMSPLTHLVAIAFEGSGWNPSNPEMELFAIATTLISALVTLGVSFYFTGASIRYFDPWTGRVALAPIDATHRSFRMTGSR